MACSVNGAVGPPMYAASDVQAASRLDAREQRLLRIIAAHVPSKTLSYTFLDGTILVFDATGGACAGGSAYELLNEYCQHYSPSDFLTAPDPDCRGTRHPWESLQP